MKVGQFGTATCHRDRMDIEGFRNDEFQLIGEQSKTGRFGVSSGGLARTFGLFGIPATSLETIPDGHRPMQMTAGPR